MKYFNIICHNKIWSAWQLNARQKINTYLVGQSHSITEYREYSFISAWSYFKKQYQEKRGQITEKWAKLKLRSNFQ